MSNARRALGPRSLASFAVAAKRLSALAAAGFVAWAGGCYAPSDGAAPSPASSSPGVVEGPAFTPQGDTGGTDPCDGAICVFGSFCCPTSVSCEAYTSVAVAETGSLPVTTHLDVTGLATGAWISTTLPSLDFGSGSCPDVVRVDVAGDRVQILVDATTRDLTECDCESAEIALHVEGWVEEQICFDGNCDVRCCDPTLDPTERDEHCTDGCEVVYPFFGPVDETVTQHGVWTQLPGSRFPVCYLSTSVDTTAFELGQVVSTTIGAKAPSGEHLPVEVYAQKGSF